MRALTEKYQPKTIAEFIGIPAPKAMPRVIER